MANCIYCGKSIVLVPSAAERARKSGVRLQTIQNYSLRTVNANQKRGMILVLYPVLTQKGIN